MLAPDIQRRVLERLGLRGPPRPDRRGLDEVYAAWCRSVPFDNVAKLVFLHEGRAGGLPGLDPVDFFETWLEQGTGGTCWTSCNALHALVTSLGFEARRTSAGMGDLDERNHGGLVVRVEGEDFSVDSSMLTGVPIPLRDGWRGGSPGLPVRVEPVDGTRRLWFTTVGGDEPKPCRLHDDPVDLAFFAERHERTRTEGAFTRSLYARRGTPSGAVVLRGRFRRELRDGRLGGREELDAASLAEALRRDVGCSPEAVARFASCGALEASLERPPGES